MATQINIFEKLKDSRDPTGLTIAQRGWLTEQGHILLQQQDQCFGYSLMPIPGPLLFYWTPNGSRATH